MANPLSDIGNAGSRCVSQQVFYEQPADPY